MASEGMTEPLERISAHLREPVDGASLAVFRIFFGVLVAFGSLRFVALGWVERFFAQPEWFVPYWGFSWVRVLPLPWMYAAFAAMAILGVLIALGVRHRISSGLFFLIFTYVELIDVANYLNHYYLLSLLSVLLVIVPADAMWALAPHPGTRARVVPRWALTLIRFQVALVYVFAGLAKLNSDWLLHAQPLNI